MTKLFYQAQSWIALAGQLLASLLILGLLLWTGFSQAESSVTAQVGQHFPDLAVTKVEDPLPVWELKKKGQLFGWAFQSTDIVDIPAYSGKPVNMLVVIDTSGRIFGI